MDGKFQVIISLFFYTDTLLIFCRYIDDVFMTTNLSKEEILQQLHETMKTDPNIKVTVTINQSLEYLDTSIENK